MSTPITDQAVASCAGNVPRPLVLTCEQLEKRYAESLADNATLRASEAKHAAMACQARLDAEKAQAAIESAMNVYLSEPDGSADHTEIAHAMYAVLERAHRAAGKEAT